MATGYSLSTHYGGQGLLDNFSFFTGHDPNNGFVDYQSKENALANNLVSIDDEYSSVRLGVDWNSTYSTSDKGRPSVRLTSQDSFTHGLFIADIYHMPASTCGTWPSFWAFNNQDNGTNWPEGGEIEIIEGANTVQRNLYSAHTTAGCKAPDSGFSGEQHSLDCSKSPDNIGCNYASPTSDTTAYGDAFNAEGGGVYALEWDSEALKIWHFPRSTIPDNIVYGHSEGPDPSTWGPPQAVFGGSSCDPDAYFFNMSLVFNINFCGDYAGNVWGKADQCNQLAPTCEEFVAGSPSSFSEAYWDINFIDVYQFGPLTNMTIPPLSENATSATATASSTATPDVVTPTHTRTITLTMAEPTPTEDSLERRTPIGGYTLIGCFKASSASETFSKGLTLPSMGSEACTANCGESKYAGIYNDICYCADTLGDAVAVGIGLCDLPCTEDDSEVCGGHIDKDAELLGPKTPVNATLATNGTLAVRTADHKDAANILLTMYANLGAEPMPPGAPAQGVCPTVDTKTATVASTKPTGDVTITSVSVQTVVPVISNATTPAKGTAAAPYPVPPKPSAGNVAPFVAAAPPSDKAASAVWTIGWGLALWFGVFGVMSVV
ncbi:concanavalin A-like lectin/glucanase domain-containing protein [Hypoxylon sp. FL1150]|nr:concanavalin A-like lectin/glucanase domain-containing protein [Hypoxylon sp. FL1150]